MACRLDSSQRANSSEEPNAEGKEQLEWLVLPIVLTGLALFPFNIVLPPPHPT